MILDVIMIITRIICGLVAAVFIVSACLYKKYQTKYRIIENIYMYTGCSMIIYGFFHMVGFAIVG